MKSFALCLALLVPTAPAFADDWPQWQGPDRNAMSKERGLLQEWPQGGPPLAWQIKGLGGGDSAPSIAAGVIYGMGSRKGIETVWALSEKDGKEIWSASLGSAFPQRMPQSKEGPGCTPTIDGEHLYVVTMAGDIACLTTKDGKVVWQKSFTKEFGGKVPTWSYRESPLVDGDKVICTPGSAKSTLIALDKLTGKVLWQSAVPGSRGAAYSSPIAIDFGGKRQYVQLTAGTLAGVAADTGKSLWTYDHPASKAGINCSTPVYHDGQVFAASAYGTGGGLAKLSKQGTDNVKAEEVYFTKKMQNHHGGMILLDGALYGANGGNEGGYLLCLDFATGKVLWDERDGKKKIKKGSIAFADNRLYYRTEDGTVLLIEPNSKAYTERGRFDQPSRSNSPAWAHPVIANGKLYIRDQDLLFCYDIAASK